MEIPPRLYTHLLDFEILSGPAIFERKGCLLVNDIKQFDSQRIWGRICESPFGTLRHLEQCGFQGYQQTDQEILFDIVDFMLEDIVQNTTVLLFNYELTAGRGEFPMQALHLKPTNDSFLVPWNNNKQTTDEWMIDLFAGGYGGWSNAMKFLTEDLQKFSMVPAFPPHRIIAVEQDIPAATSHALNHDMVLLPDEKLRPFWFRQHPESTVINAPIQSHGWKQAVAMLNPDLWTISHPCQSWTNAAHAKGFDDQNGLAFASALGLIRVFRPKHVALENVKHFQDHGQFPLVQALIRWAGYKVLHQGIYDASQRLPVKRPRYLAVLKRIEDEEEEFKWISWHTNPNCTPNVWDAWTPTPPPELSQFSLAPEARCMYLDPKLLPMGRSQEYQQDMMKFRVPPTNQKLPVFMAAYGSHHLLPFPLQRDKGMHGFFTRENGTFRWFKPEEILMLHSHPYSCTLLKPAEMAWKFLGNAIVIHHGILVLTNILGHRFGAKTDEEFQIILQTLDNRRLRANTTMVFSDEYAWYIGQKEQMVAQQSQLRFLALQLNWLGNPNPEWPGGVFFHPSHGLQKFFEQISVEKTIPLTIEDSTDNEESCEEPSNQHCDITLAASPGTYGILQIADMWQWNDIHDLWGDKFQPYTIGGYILNQCIVPTKAILMPTQDEEIIQVPEQQRHCVLWDDEQGSHCLVVIHGIQWKDIQRDNAFLADYHFDDYGEIPPEMKIKTSLRVHIDPIECQPFPELSSFVSSFEAVSTVAITPGKTDILVIVFIGPAEDLIRVLTFWHYALNANWLECHGRQICFQVEHSAQARLIFRPQGDKFAIQSQLIKTVFASYHHFDAKAFVKVQFEHRYVSEIALPEHQTFADFYQLCQHVTLFSNNGLTPPLLVGLKRVGDDVTIGKLVDHYGQNFRCIVGPTLIGGTNRTAHKQTVQASLAAALLEHGTKLEEVSKHVQTIIKEVGIPKLTQLLFVADEQEKHDQIGAIIQACGIPIHAKATKVSTSKAKYTKIALDQQMKQSRQIDVSQYKLMPGFFTRTNGEPLPIQATFSPCISGVTMMPSANAEQWLLHKGKIIPEEMALFLIGDLTEQQQIKTQKVVAPAYNTSGDQVSLAGWLLQLGEAEVKLSTHDAPKVQTLDVQVCSVTLWANDFTKDQWHEIVRSPVKQTKQILDQDQLGDVIKNPWGRTFRQGRNPCSPSDATSVQFHTEIMIKDLRRLLHRSGFNKVYITPKEPGGAPSQEWRIIWTSDSPQTLEAQTMSQPGAAGLVKGNKNYGIRVEPSAFNQIWALLHPGEDPPKQIPKGNLWRLHPLPYGIDKQVMQEWADNVGWSSFPIRPLGAKSWLMQSQDPPPNRLLSFNGQPLIIKSMPSKNDAIPTGLVAGPKSRPTTEQQVMQTNIFRTGDPYHDAWAAWQPSSKPGKSEQVTAESVPGPTTAHLQQHDQQLQNLEQAIKQLEEAHTKKDSQDAVKFADLENSIVQNHQQIQGAFHTLRNDFQSSLSQAISQQDSKLSKGFEELKDLFRQRDKRRKPEKSDEMESSE